MNDPITALLEIFRQFSFVAAVLGGFAVTLVVGLLPAAPDRKVAAWAAGAALLAAALLIVCTTAAVTAVIFTVDRPALGSAGAVPKPLLVAFRWCGVSFTVGLLAFLAALGLTGWVRSRAMGIASSVVSALTILLVLYYLTSVVHLL